MKNTKNPEKYLLDNDEGYFGSKYTFIKVIFIVALTYTLSFSFINLYLGDEIAFVIQFGASIVQIYTLWRVFKNKETLPAAYIGLLALIVVLLHLFATGGIADTGILWLFLAPPVIFFLLGSRNAHFYTVILITGLIYIFIMQKRGSFNQIYSDFNLFIFSLVFLFASVLMYVYQSKVETTISQLIEDRKKIEQLSKLRREFISVVSHQLRTPLNSIRWNSEILLEETNEDNKQINTVKEIYQASISVIERIGDMVFATDILENRVKLKFKELNPIPIIEDILEEMSKRFDRENLVIKLKSFNESTKVNASLGELSECFRIIIENAFEYTNEDDKIEICTDKTEDKFVLIVKDKGLQISMKDKDEIFALFGRGNKANEYNPNGSGISLFIANYFIKEHGGEISLKLDDGWTEFRIELPLISSN